MVPEKFEMFRNRLMKVFRHLSKQARRQGVSCYRIYDHDLPEFNFCIELYGQQVYLAEYKRRFELAEAVHEEWLEQCIAIIADVLQVADEQIYMKQRQRKTSRLGQYQRLATEEAYFTVEEGGLQFKVNLSDFLDTGLFLDHRMTRDRVRAEAAGKRVLNLFCYTGSFSVYAAAGNAASVTSVDLSKTYLQWAEDNLRLNQLYDPQKHFYVHADVLQYLGTLAPGSFDLVVLDPPTFSNSKRMKDFLDIQQDHVSLLNDTLRALTPGGLLYFSTNYTKFVLEEQRIQASEIRDVTKATTPFDFQGKLERWCFRLVK
ncbi:MAG: class I SAM-dependent methyltransferase [Candidatus Pseudobacter hemicellulosilyticus]|uniref:Class I SAM-dependent methyltransferase n=1 Tax=Candidatus Pseudobacter hemicellulosilyticus TaxID=3121375 RepID=A0AAJ6BJA9_9BACT|nr:MAG: class I SAM-dependent methyltransferase [Pseudobacter sp.]